MKKYLAVFLGVLLIFSFAVTASADTDIAFSGKILTKGWLLQNVTWLEHGVVGLPYESPSDSKTQTFYHSNFNLMIDAKVTDNVQGFAELETGVSNRSGLYYWGKNDYDGKPDTEIWIKQLWIQYTGSGLLGVPSGIKIGHMPIMLGEGQFLNNTKFGNDGILLWIDATKELQIAAATTKINEGSVYSHSDDLDGYFLFGTYQWDKDNTIGVNYTWAHSDGNCPSIDDSINVDTLDFNNIGLHGNGMIAGLTYAAEVDWQFGDIEGLPGDPDLEAKGWGVFVKLGYMLDPVNIRASFAMGSGDDDAWDNDCEEFKTLQGPDYAFTSRQIHYTQIYERFIATAAWDATLTTTPGGNWTNTGIANTTYYNLGIDVSPMKDLMISLDGFLLNATETGAWEDTMGADVSDDIGWEVDATLTWKIAKNLKYFVEAGYFKADNFYEDTMLLGNDPDEVIQAMHGISLEF